MKRFQWLQSSAVIALVLLILAGNSFAEDLDGYTFLKISGQDARAVVKSPEGEKRLVNAGDMLGDLEVTEIGENRVVLKKTDGRSVTVLIVRLVDGRQTVDKIEDKQLSKTQSVGAKEALNK